MLVKTNYPIINNFFIVKNNKLVNYIEYSAYYQGDNSAMVTKTHIDLTTQSTNIKKNTGVAKIQYWNKLIKKFCWNLGLFYYKKIKFTGKGYKIKKIKKKKSFKLYFGKAHYTYIFSGGLNLKRLTKYKLLMVNNNRKRLNKIANNLCNVRLINKFTKRGLRLSKHFILKRPGKKTNY